MTQHLQSTKQGQVCEYISDQTPTEPEASQNHTCSPAKEPLSPERAFIATYICDWTVSLVLVSQGNHLMLQHIRLVRKPMWLQAVLLTAQLYAMICLLSVGFGRGWKAEKESQRSSVTRKPKVKLPIKHIAVKLKL